MNYELAPVYALHTIDGRKLTYNLLRHYVVGDQQFHVASEYTVVGIDGKILDVNVEGVGDDDRHILCDALSVNATHFDRSLEGHVVAHVPFGSHDVCAKRRL